MARKYEMRKRAEARDATRRRIVEAAIDLHTTIGPAHTTVSAIAERAGVQRHTYYRHFPDERELGLACSGLYTERNPMPDPAPWGAIADPVERFRTALAELYGYFAANEGMLANVTRDAQFDAETRAVMNIRMGPTMGAMQKVLTADVPEGALALLGLALQFPTWHSLVRDSGLSHERAVETMTAAVESAIANGAPRTRRRRRSAAPRPPTARS